MVAGFCTQLQIVDAVLILYEQSVQYPVVGLAFELIQPDARGLNRSNARLKLFFLRHTVKAMDRTPYLRIPLKRDLQLPSWW